MSRFFDRVQMSVNDRKYEMGRLNNKIIEDKFSGVFKCPWCDFNIDRRRFNFEIDFDMEIRNHIYQMYYHHYQINNVANPDKEDTKIAINWLRQDPTYLQFYKFTNKYAGVMFENNFKEYFECYPDRKRYFPEMDEKFIIPIQNDVKFSVPYNEQIWNEIYDKFERKREEEYQFRIKKMEEREKRLEEEREKREKKEKEDRLNHMDESLTNLGCVAFVDNSDDTCAICYEKCNAKTSCLHSFCKDCLYTWLIEGDNDNCPYCKQNIKNTDNEDETDNDEVEE